MTKVKEAGLDKEDKWTFPDGPRIYARACQWMERLGEKQKNIDSCVEDLERQMQDFSFSTDISATKAIIACAEACNVNDEAVAVFKERSAELEKQLRLCTELQKKSMDVAQAQKLVRQVKDAGLEDAGKWLLPQGARLAARASRINSSNLQAIQAELAQEEKEFAEFSKADLEWQLSNLRSQIAFGSIQELLGSEIVTSLKKRCDDVEKQITNRHQLQLCIYLDKADFVHKTEADARLNKLED